MGHHNTGKNNYRRAPYNGNQGYRRNDYNRDNRSETIQPRVNPWIESSFRQNVSPEQSSIASTSTASRNVFNSTYNQEDINVVPNDNPFNLSNKVSVEEEDKKRLRNLSLMPYLERRNLKGLLNANPRFHLMEFKGVPKFIKPSAFLEDLTQSMPDLKVKHFISIHIQRNASDDSFVDYKVGFNNIKIISRLKEIMGTGSIDLYKSSVQLVFPNVDELNMCEYNRVISDEIGGASAKNPYKLTHGSTNLLAAVKMLENVCQERIWFVTAICCNGIETYINLGDASLLFCLNRHSHDCKYKVEPSDTAAFVGLIPSEFIPPTDELTTPVNITATAKLMPEEIVKYNGFKVIFEKHATDVKTAQIDLIKRSLLETQSAVSSQFSNLEFHLEQEFNAIKGEVETCKIQLGINENNLNVIDGKIDVLNATINNTFELLTRYVTKRDDKKYEQLARRMTSTGAHGKKTNDIVTTLPTASASTTHSVNPAISGTTETDYDDDILDVQN